VNDAVQPELVILDLDGVLVDSELLSSAVLVELCAEHGLDVDAAHVRERFLGRSWPTVAEGLRARAARSLPPDFEALYRARLLARFEPELAPVPGAAETVPRLSVPACVATSSSPVRAERSLSLTGIGRLGLPLFTASQVARGKPAPDLFLFAAAAMGADPARCLVVEDSRPGLVAARAPGMAAVLFLGGGHHGGRDPGWGRDFDPPVPSVASWAAFAALWPQLFAAEGRGT
jgi:HAD superfamily hydrolase (TIGR01509 family)